jgi:predicted acylesterase/phospholipase RssA
MKPSIGVALSGGGHRSALFGVGALFYLVSSQRAGSIRTVASVSGGSYTNARTQLLEGGIQNADSRRFIEHFRPFVTGPTRASPVTEVVTVPAILGILAIVVIFWQPLPFVSSPPIQRWSRWIALAVLLLLVLLVPRLGRLMARRTWHKLFHDVVANGRLGRDIERELVPLSPGGRRTDLRYRSKSAMSDAAKATPTPTHHVYCTTELSYGRFVYMTNRLVFHPRLGRASPGEYSLRQAVDASTAIPLVFAPVKIRTEPFLSASQDTPKFVLCVDGGIRDTLATEWFRPEMHRGRTPRFDDPRTEPEDVVLVVDGSAPIRDQRYLPRSTFAWGRRNVPLFWWMKGHARSIRLAFSNWDRRNLQQLQQDPSDGMIGLSIGDTPYWGNVSPDQHRELAKCSVDWRKIVHENGAVTARPRRLTARRIHELMYHGYVMAYRAVTDADSGIAPSPSDRLVAYQAFCEMWALDD